MARLIITPVGTSLRETALCWTALPTPLTAQHYWTSIRDNDTLLSRARELRQHIWSADATGNSIANRFDVDAWNSRQLKRLSAELASLKLIDEAETLQSSDTIWLIHGTADPLPAQALEKILSLEYVEWSARCRPLVKPKPLPGLDATKPALFGKALGDLRSWLKDLGVRDGRIYNLTAGYKGTALYLGVHAHDDARAEVFPVQRYYLFEDSTELIRIETSTAGQEVHSPVPVVPR